MVGYRWRLWQAGLLIAGILVLLTASLDAQTKKPANPGKSAASPLFQDAMARAKKSQQPLIMFGVSEGCVRCAALKEGLASQPEIKELMTHYVAAEIPFGGREFATVLNSIIKQDAKYNQPIGAPSVFIFTSKGNVVYAGPNHPSGMQPGETFMRLLQEGIDKNGGPKTAAKPPVASASASAPPASEPPTKAAPGARLWKDKTGKFSVTATLLSFDGKTAQFKTAEGKTVSVLLEALSVEDQEFLRGQETKK